jgi:hypothetical protein
MKKPVSSKNYLLTLNLISFAQMLTLVVFSGVVLFLKNTDQITLDEGLAHLFLYIVPLFVIASLAAAYFIFDMMLGKVNSALPLKQKLIRYQVAYIIRTAVLEVSGLLGAVAALITGEIYFLSAPLLIILIFFLLRPSAHHIAADLKLSIAERDLLQDPQAFVSETEH